ncbi:MAG: methyltransferase domain-containing protein [Bacteroidetes bacterium]|nr:methyltransferase domain-containing protein [Bacteroidota bacterium]
MRLSEHICLLLNNCFPKVKVAGRESPQAYTEAQYGWAQASYDLYAPFIDMKDKTVLDAGCGPGGKTVFYAEKGCKLIIGIDIDENRLSLAKEFSKHKKIQNTEFYQGSLDSMPFESDTFDIVLLNDVVEHIGRPILIKALAECKRVIKPGGKICLEFPPWTSFGAAHLYDCIYIPWCHILFSDKTLINVIKKLKPEHPTVGNLSYIEHFEELNRITINEFKEMISNLEFKIIVLDYIMILGLKFMRYIPVINKYWTRRVVGVLSK